MYRGLGGSGRRSFAGRSSVQGVGIEEGVLSAEIGLSGFRPEDGHLTASICSRNSCVESWVRTGWVGLSGAITTRESIRDLSA